MQDARDGSSGEWWAWGKLEDGGVVGVERAEREGSLVCYVNGDYGEYEMVGEIGCANLVFFEGMR